MSAVACPRCELPMGSRDGRGDWRPNCNPLRSPGCWSVVARLPKRGSPEAQIIRRATRNEG